MSSRLRRLALVVIAITRVPSPRPVSGHRAVGRVRYQPRSWPLPGRTAVARLARVLEEYPGWSVFWDKACGVWRAAENDPRSALHAESPDLDMVISYITAHS